jgi:hypothetical protein
MKVGRKSTYDAKMLPALVESVRKAKGSMGQVADLNCVPRQTFRDWLSDGDHDNIMGLSTELGQLSCSIRKEQAIVVTEMADLGLNNYKKAKFIMWWLSMICREDFGQESEEFKQLKELVFSKILPLIGKEALYGKQTEKLDQEST